MKGSYTLYCRCTQEQTGCYGTRFLVMKEVMPFNERICKIRIEGKNQNISLVNVHAPNDKDDEMKEVFYEDLQNIVDRIPKHEILLIIKKAIPVTCLEGP